MSKVIAKEVGDMSLEELFAAADAVGDKYLSQQEIAARDAELLAVKLEFWNSASDDLLELL